MKRIVIASVVTLLAALIGNYIYAKRKSIAACDGDVPCMVAVFDKTFYDVQEGESECPLAYHKVVTNPVLGTYRCVQERWEGIGND
jgi:hypothetical protein